LQKGRQDDMGVRVVRVVFVMAVENDFEVEYLSAII
jgi:hypothetical protein